MLVTAAESYRPSCTPANHTGAGVCAAHAPAPDFLPFTVCSGWLYSLPRCRSPQAQLHDAPTMHQYKLHFSSSEAGHFCSLALLLFCTPTSLCHFLNFPSVSPTFHSFSFIPFIFWSRSFFLFLLQPLLLLPFFLLSSHLLPLCH